MSIGEQNAAWQSAFSHVEPVTPSDSAKLNTTMQLIVTGAGNAVLVDYFGNQTTWTGLTVGTRIPGLFSQVKSTGTTATFAGLY